MEIIGAGFGRTGTASLKKALEILGYDPCYHMFEVLEHGDVDKWLDVVEADNGRAYDFDEIFATRGYKAAVDHPASGYYKLLMKQYPDAKVILTIRDTPDVWFESAKETIYQHADKTLANLGYSLLSRLSPTLRKFKRMGRLTIWDNPQVFNGNFDTRGRQIYVDWIEDVKRSVPKDKLLVFNVKDGWAPLCTFLRKQIPNVPFPRVNDRKEFKERSFKIGMRFAANIFAIGSVIVALIAVAFLRK